MKKSLELILVALMGIGCLWAGIAIVLWGVAKLKLARDSRDWPAVEGRVIESTVDRSEKEHQPRVVYAYSLAGTSYESSQISFAPFDKPGGVGRVESIVDRYPVGRPVTVYYKSDEPGVAILEPEVYSPFYIPLFFGVLIFCLGAFALWKNFRQVVNPASDSRPSDATNKRFAVTAFVSVLIYAVLVLVSMDSAIQDTYVRVFGERPAGLPCIVFVLGLQTLLYLPMPLVFWHGFRLVRQAMEDRTRFGIWYILTVSVCHPHLLRSQIACIAGLVYFFVACGIWAICATARGI